MSQKIEDSVFELISSTLKVDRSIVSLELAMGDIPEWDSLAHISLLTAVEGKLGRSLDIEETIEIEDVSDIMSLFDK